MESREHSIVIVEDEGLIAVDLRGRLERAGYRVPGIAGTAVEALDVIREKSPDLILMDIRLRGGSDGIQVAEQVLRDFDIPVVYLTAYEDRKTLERASQTQAFGYIKKPIDGASLQGSIEMAISKHRHERHLREQRDWLSASFAALPDAVLVADVSGRTCYINPVAEELFGCTANQALGRPSGELLRIKRDNGEPLEDLMPVVMLQETTVRWPAGIWLEGAGGKRCAIEGGLAPRWTRGRMDGVVVTFHDVTLCRFEEEQSRLNNKHDALSRLADGVAGHLDLELSVVAEENTRLLSSLPTGSPLRSSAEAIQSAALNACAVTCGLREYGQDREIKPQVVQVNDTLADLEKTWRRVFPDLTVQFDPNPRPVHADANGLSHALKTLFRHALQWMQAGGGIAISAAGAELEGLAEWVRIRLTYKSAREDGAALERAFDPSWDGNWEGLPAAYSVTKRMGGLLRAHLEPDQNVVFEIYLPSVEVAATGLEMEAEEQETLLLIEPNSEVRRLLRAYFEQHGYRVIEARDCEDALLLAQSDESPIRLAIANPAQGDRYRTELVNKLIELKAGICVRVIDGYREEGTDAQPGRFLAKRQLIEWADRMMQPAVLSSAAN